MTHNPDQQLTYIDLFAGAGGLSEGFTRAGFKPVAHVEMDKNACYTLKTRIAYHYLNAQKKENIYNLYLTGEKNRDELYSYIPEELLGTVINAPITDKTFNEIAGKILGLINHKKRVDLIIGGPPCQAYSVIGRSRDPNRMEKDPRNYLFKYYIQFLEEFNPKVFIFENVPGLLTAGKNQKYLKEMVNGFEETGYKVQYEILNAADFGVLQNRQRVILIGWKKKLNFHYPKFKEKRSDSKLIDLLNDLPYLKPAIGNKTSHYTKEISKNHYLFIKNIRNGIPYTTQHFARPLNKNDEEIYRIAIENFEEGERLKYDRIPARLQKHKNKDGFQDRFKVLDKNNYSHSILAHINKDGHYYIYPDLNQVRSISVREAARIQSFPDNYFFEGGQGPAFRQIGNAVPPLMAEEIAREIKGILGLNEN